jgi:flagellar biogenesis protein FliO
VGLGVFALIISAVPTWSQTLGQGADDGISIWRVVLALVLCLGLAVAVPFALKAKAGGLAPLRTVLRRSRRLHLVESLCLGHQTDLCLVRVDDRLLLVSVSPKGLEVLEHMPDEPASAGDRP